MTTIEVIRTDRAEDVCDDHYVNRTKALQAAKELPGDETLQDLAETFKVLSSPTRLKILHALSAQELCVCDLATVLGSTESAVSHQLRLLRSLRLVRHRREGRMVYYALDDDHIEKLLAQGLDHVAHG